jgi:hypothetical protein
MTAGLKSGQHIFGMDVPCERLSAGSGTLNRAGRRGA